MDDHWWPCGLVLSDPRVLSMENQCIDEICQQMWLDSIGLGINNEDWKRKKD